MRVELQWLLGYIADLEEKRKERVQEKKEEGVRVEISKELKESKEVDYENLQKRVEDIRERLQKGSYEVSPEKILIGLEKYLFSK
ncbi:MAG: flagellar biosynthesis anti-sigma factor FlgM [Aquificaceae bacterium]